MTATRGIRLVEEEEQKLFAQVEAQSVTNFKSGDYTFEFQRFELQGTTFYIADETKLKR